MFIHGKQDGLINYQLIEDLFTKVNPDLLAAGQAWLHIRPVMYHNCYHIVNDLINPGYDIIDELAKHNELNSVARDPLGNQKNIYNPPNASNVYWF